MADELMQEWARYVQSATDGMKNLLELRSSNIEQFLRSGEDATATIDSLDGMTWQDTMNELNDLIRGASEQLRAAQQASAGGRAAIEAALTEAELWPPDISPNDPEMMAHAAQDLARSGTQFVQGTLANGPPVAGNTLIGQTVEAVAPTVEAVAPTVEAVAPTVEAIVPQVEAVLPQVEAVVPAVESVLPSLEAALPAAVPTIEAIVPVIEQNAPVIVATGTAVVGGTVAAAETGTLGTLAAGAASGAPGGPIGIAVGVGVTLVLIGGVWWATHRDPGKTTTQNVVAAQTSDAPHATEAPPTTAAPDTVVSPTTLAAFSVTTQPTIAVTTTATVPPGTQLTTVPATAVKPVTTTVLVATTTASGGATGAKATVQVKVVGTMACSDQGLAVPDKAEPVTIDGTPIPYSPGDNTARTTTTPGSHAVGGDGDVISINFQRSGGAENQHVVGSSGSFTFGAPSGSLDYVVAVRFKDPAC